MRVANVPKEEFDQLVGSDNPRTVSQSADKGKKARPQPKPQQHPFVPGSEIVGYVDFGLTELVGVTIAGNALTAVAGIFSARHTTGLPCAERCA